MSRREILEEIPTPAWMFLFHYHPKWLEYGLLDEALLVEQSKDINLLHLEHLRSAMFHHILETRPGLSDLEVSHYLELTLSDEDQAMAQSARIDLLLWEGLTPEQLEHLATLPEYAISLMQKLAARRRLLNQLSCTELTDELFADCLACRDSTIHYFLLENVSLTEEHLTRLAEAGCNCAIRNIAQNRRKSHTKRKIEEEFLSVAEN